MKIVLGYSGVILVFALTSVALAQSKPATEATKAANVAVLEQLPFSDQEDFANAKRVFIAAIEGGKIQNAQGRAIWDISQFAFVDPAAGSPAVVPATGLIAPTSGAPGSDRIQLADSSGSTMIMTAQNTGAEEGMSLEKAAQKSNNPVSDAWLLITQNDLTSLDTPDGSEWRNRTSLQPVMPVPILDGEWNIVNRIVTGVVTAPIDDDPNSTDPFDGRTTGVTDTVYFALAAPNRDDGWIWGLGPTFILPTATDDVLGQEKWQAGPAGLLVRLGNDYGGFGIEHFNLGVLAQHWWHFAGNDDRASTSQSDIQYFINWKATPTQLIGMTPNIQIDWKKSGSDRFSVPIGLGTIGLFRLGKIPIRWGIEAQYYVMQPDPVGPEFNLKLFFAPIVGNPFK